MGEFSRHLKVTHQHPDLRMKKQNPRARLSLGRGRPVLMEPLTASPGPACCPPQGRSGCVCRLRRFRDSLQCLFPPGAC